MQIMKNINKSIKSYSSEGLESLAKELGQPRFRARQIMKWLYGEGVSSYDKMTNLPKTLRETLSLQHPLYSPTVINRQISQDDTRKYILEYADGNKVETVAIPSTTSTSPTSSKLSAASQLSTAGRKNALDRSSLAERLDSPDFATLERLTVCLSTQVGCAMGCAFCATGKEGFSRNLLPGEIIDQILIVQNDTQRRVSNLVTMGQGEPFLNYENTLAALRFANSSNCLNIGARHIVISSCGIIGGINQLSKEPEQFTLAISLHSALQDIRNKLMPKTTSAPLPQLKTSLLDYLEATSRRITLEYVMIDRVNDSPESLRALIEFCSGLLCHINLIPINPIKDSPFKSSCPKTISTWTALLEKNRIPVTVRNSRGSDIAGACGQLKNSL